MHEWFVNATDFIIELTGLILLIILAVELIKKALR